MGFMVTERQDSVALNGPFKDTNKEGEEIGFSRRG
jgi:hypothetical protein